MKTIHNWKISSQVEIEDEEESCYLVGEEKIEDLGKGGFKYTLINGENTYTVTFDSKVIINGKTASKQEKIQAARNIVQNMIEDYDDEYDEYDDDDVYYHDDDTEKE